MTLRTALKRFDYLVHRWIGITLGGMMFVWFTSGIVMMYYPYPELTESRQLALLRGYQPDESLIGFGRAAEAYRAREGRSEAADSAPSRVVGGRLMIWNQKAVYQLWHQQRRYVEPIGLVDA